MGYILAFLTGAEVFTTNNLAMMSLASKKVTRWDLTRNWLLVLIANIIGGIVIVIMFILSGLVNVYDGAFAEEVIQTTSLKLSFTPIQTFFSRCFRKLFDLLRSMDRACGAFGHG